MSRTMILSLAGAVVLLCAAALLAVGVPNVQGSEPGMVTVRPYGKMDRAAAREFTRYELYDVGTDFEGLPLTAIDSQRGPAQYGEPTGVDEVMFAYGTCEVPAASTEGGCAVPLTIQVWSACERYRELYAFQPDESLTLRGVDAAFYENFRRLELYTGRVTVVLFGTGRGQLMRAAAKLRGVNRLTTTADRLPPEARGAQSGGLSC